MRTLDLAAWRTYELGNLRARREYAARIAAEEPARCLGRDCRRHARTNSGLCLKCHSEEAALQGIPHNDCKENHE